MSLRNAQWLSLDDSEEIIWWSHPSMVVEAPSILLSLVITAVTFLGAIYLYVADLGANPLFQYGHYALFALGILALLYGGWTYLVISNIYYVITSDHVVRKRGVVGHTKKSKSHDQIVRVDVEVSPMKAILSRVTRLDVGNVTIRSADDRGDEFIMRNVPATGVVERELKRLANEDREDRDRPYSNDWPDDDSTPDPVDDTSSKKDDYRMSTDTKSR